MTETLFWLRIPFVTLLVAFVIYLAWVSIRRPE
jgi:hypothetical protein